MRITKEIRLWFIALVAVQAIMALGVIQLLNRMSPAIEHILQENVYSIEAVEEMLVVLASGHGAEAEQRQRFAAALERARGNITEPDEVEVIARITAVYDAAIDHNQAARYELVALVQRLGEINRRSMDRADAHARRLGTAGAWAVVLLGTASFLLCLLAIRRLRVRFLTPLEEMYSVLLAVRAGERLRRCFLSHAGLEFSEMSGILNRLLDERWNMTGENNDT